MKVTTLGVIVALKNLAVWLSANWMIIDIRADLTAFLYALLIYALLSVPSDLYLMNKAHEQGQNEPQETLPT